MSRSLAHTEFVRGGFGKKAYVCEEEFLAKGHNTVGVDNVKQGVGKPLNRVVFPFVNLDESPGNLEKIGTNQSDQFVEGVECGNFRNGLENARALELEGFLFRVEQNSFGFPRVEVFVRSCCPDKECNGGEDTFIECASVLRLFRCRDAVIDVQKVAQENIRLDHLSVLGNETVDAIKAEGAKGTPLVAFGDDVSQPVVAVFDSVGGDAPASELALGVGVFDHEEQRPYLVMGFGLLGAAFEFVVEFIRFIADVWRWSIFNRRGRFIPFRRMAKYFSENGHSKTSQCLHPARFAVIGQGNGVAHG